MSYNECPPLIREIHVALEREANNTLRQYDLTMVQLYLLLAAQGQAGGCPLKTLEKRMHIAQSTTACIVKRLAEKGFLTCCEDASDKRAKYVRLTDAGEQLCLTARQALDRLDRQLTDGMSEQEQRQFLCLLRKAHSSLCPSFT